MRFSHLLLPDGKEPGLTLLHMVSCLATLYYVSDIVSLRFGWPLRFAPGRYNVWRHYTTFSSKVHKVFVNSPSSDACWQKADGPIWRGGMKQKKESQGTPCPKPAFPLPIHSGRISLCPLKISSGFWMLLISQKRFIGPKVPYSFQPVSYTHLLPCSLCNIRQRRKSHHSPSFRLR